jgi:hypothetical protein
MLTVLGRQVRVPSSAAIVDERTGDGVDVSGLRRDDDEQAREPMRSARASSSAARRERVGEEGNYDLDDTADRADQWVSRLQVLARRSSPPPEATEGVAQPQRAPAGRLARVAAGHRVQEAYVMAHRGRQPRHGAVGRSASATPASGSSMIHGRRPRERVFGAWSVEGAVADGVRRPGRRPRPQDKRHQIASLAARSADAAR